MRGCNVDEVLVYSYLNMQVADFGLSKQKQQTYVSGVASSRGTLPWIAPEIIKSPDAVDEKVWNTDSRPLTKPHTLSHMLLTMFSIQRIDLSHNVG